jgi:hypothetical protein
MDNRTIAAALGGEVNAGQVCAPGPGHSKRDRSLSVKVDSSAPDGFVVHSFSGDDAIVCKDYVRSKLGLGDFKPNGRGNGQARFQRRNIAAPPSLPEGARPEPGSL